MEIGKKYVNKRKKLMEIIMFYKRISEVDAFNLANDLMRIYHPDIPRYVASKDVKKKRAIKPKNTIPNMEQE